jgi:GTP cyclohydrolase FolE2
MLAVHLFGHIEGQQRPCSMNVLGIIDLIPISSCNLSHATMELAAQRKVVYDHKVFCTSMVAATHSQHGVCDLILHNSTMNLNF